MMTNRSFSHRFFKKYKKDFLYALRKYIISFGKHQRNDIMIPWKDKGKISKRFYHIYTLAELNKLLSLSGFVPLTLCYLSKGNKDSSRKISQNSLVIAKKIVFLKND